MAQTSPFPQGTPVGRGVNQPVGTQLPAVGQNPGKPIGMIGPNGETLPLPSQEKPVGAIDVTKNLAAPVVGPGSGPTKSSLEKLYDRWRSAIGFDKPAAATTTGWTPGLARRNRERREQKLAGVRD